MTGGRPTPGEPTDPHCPYEGSQRLCAHTVIVDGEVLIAPTRVRNRVALPPRDRGPYRPTSVRHSMSWTGLLHGAGQWWEGQLQEAIDAARPRYRPELNVKGARRQVHRSTVFRRPVVGGRQRPDRCGPRLGPPRTPG